MKPSEIIAEARVLIQDTSAPYRYSDTDMLSFVNKALRRISVLRPDLFAMHDFIPTQAGVVFQQLPEEAARLIEIYYVQGGRACTEVHRETLDQNIPTWVSATPAHPVNWMRHPRSPRNFFLSPPPSENVTLFCEYAVSPRNYRIGEVVELLPDAYQPAVVDATVFYAESIDNEHANSGRAEAAYNRMVQMLGINQQQRVVTDNENAGIG